MAEPARKRAIYADLPAPPPELVAEIIDGELVTHPRPSPRHSASAAALAGELTTPFQKGRDGRGGRVFFIEPEPHLGADALVSDLAGWRRERLTACQDTPYFEIAPDWICEVLSPSTESRDRGAKRRIYAQHGVCRLWLLDPRFQLLEVFALTEGRWVLIGTWQSDEVVSAPPFEAISISLADPWPLDRPLGFAQSPQHLFAGDR